MRFIAFNVPQEREQFKEIDTKDVKIKKAFSSYNKALILQNEEKYDEAKLVYEEIMKSSIFEEKLQKVKNIQSSPIHLVHFVVLKNYAIILEKISQIEDAIEYYEKAIIIDSTDTNLWYRIGELYQSNNYYEKAYDAYKKALDNSNTNISLWKALTGISNVLYEIGDFVTCLKYVNRALDINPGWIRGIWIKYDILYEFTQNLSFNSTLPLRCTFSDIQEFNNKKEQLKLLFKKYPEETKKRKSKCFCKLIHSCKNITYFLDHENWKELGELLLKIYNDLIKKKQKVESCVLAPVKIEFASTDIPTKSPSEASNSESNDEMKNEFSEENRVSTNDKKRKRFLITVEDNKNIRTSKRVREKIEQETKQTEEKDIYLKFKKKVNFIIPKKYNFEMGGKVPNESTSNENQFILVENIKSLESNIEYKFLGLKLNAAIHENKTKIALISKNFSNDKNNIKNKAGNDNDTDKSDNEENNNNDNVNSTNFILSLSKNKSSQELSKIVTSSYKDKIKNFIEKLNKTNQNILNLLLEFSSFFMIEYIHDSDLDNNIKNNWLNWKWPEEMNKCIFTIWKILEKHGAGSSLFKIYFSEEYKSQANRIWIKELFISNSELFLDTFIIENNKNENILISKLNSTDMNSIEFKLFIKWWSILSEYVYFNPITDQKRYIRYLWLKYQYEYLIGNDEEAKYNLDLLLKQDFVEVIYHNAHYIKKLTPSVVKLHLCMINAFDYINETNQMFLSKQYQGIISHLRILFDNFFESDTNAISQQFHESLENWSKSDNIQFSPENQLYHCILLEYINKCTISRRFELLELLVKSYQELNQVENVFICFVYMLIDITTNVLFIENNDVILKFHYIFFNIVKVIAQNPSYYLEKLNGHSEKIFSLFISIIFLFSRIGLYFFEHSLEIYQHLKTLSKEDNTIEHKFNTLVLDIWTIFAYTLYFLKDKKIIEQKEKTIESEIQIDRNINYERNNEKDSNRKDSDGNIKANNKLDELVPMVIDDEDDDKKETNEIINITEDKDNENKDNDDIIIIDDIDKKKTNDNAGGVRKNSVNSHTNHSKKSSNNICEDENENTSFKDKVNNIITDLLSYIHEELGYLHICNYSEGRFLKLCISHLKNLDCENKDYSLSIYLCYYCLYHIDGLYEVDDHETEEIELDNDTILEYTKYLGNDVITNFSSLTNKQRQLALDSLDYLNDTIAKNEPGLDKIISSTVKRNKQIIKYFLKSNIGPFDLDYSPCTKEFRPLISTWDIQLKKKEMGVIPKFYNIFYYIKGQLLYSLHKPKTSDDNLQEAIDSFQFNLYLNPTHYDSWFSLGKCYYQYSCEKIEWSAFEFLDKLKRITRYQKKAFHCFVRAVKLMRNSGLEESIFGKIKGGKESYHNDRNEEKFIYKEKELFLENYTLHYTKEEIAKNLWSKWGYLIYICLVKSELHNTLKFSKNTSTYIKLPVSIQDQIPKSRKFSVFMQNISELPINNDIEDAFYNVLWKFCFYCFSMAMKYDNKHWEYSYMLGRVSEKLKRENSVIIRYYISSINIINSQHNVDKVYEPLIKLISYLCKALIRHDIEPEIAISLMDKFGNHDHINMAMNPELVWDNELQKSETLYDKAFDRLLIELKRIRYLDKKNWYDKPTYKISWIYLKVKNDPNKAQEIIQTIFQLKNIIKRNTIISVWNKDYDLPGRYFYAIKFYIEYFSEILKETNDIETLKLLLFKVYNATATILLYPKKSRKIVFTTYIEAIKKIEDKISTISPLEVKKLDRDQVIEYLKLHENLINRDITGCQGKLRSLLFDTFDIYNKLFSNNKLVKTKDKTILMGLLINIYLKILNIVHENHLNNEELKDPKFFKEEERREMAKINKLIEIQLVSYCKQEKAIEKSNRNKGKEKEKEKINNESKNISKTEEEESNESNNKDKINIEIVDEKVNKDEEEMKNDEIIIIKYDEKEDNKSSKDDNNTKDDQENDKYKNMSEEQVIKEMKIMKWILKMELRKLRMKILLK
ncbi:hypothetical protein BCR36DRAFT_70132 [Piromyces finnis]|uniref:Uncharacterized protein n=1 Tax=Piromyces finnis TaxID=1754191 RepID=A0A1Y1V7Y5_9FUNG|nr:hypothetical protein BCR36DRAFT_70132 [Piromyces finnis]|eukprot:ORX48951.1 hypothetical protein BCR36DRAFT_70132 [Piromyces finnis]